jgi:glycosyltransferase involved in cell wall biosynthesis
VGLARKRQLLADARCLLIPSTVAETSSLVAMEAFAAGTPVVAFGAGALPEIVEHGRNGFLVHDAHEMAEAIGKTAGLDPEACRSSARSRFSADRMVQRYFETYGRIVSGAGQRRPFGAAAAQTAPPEAECYPITSSANQF